MSNGSVFPLRFLSFFSGLIAQVVLRSIPPLCLVSCMKGVACTPPLQRFAPSPALHLSSFFYLFPSLLRHICHLSSCHFSLSLASMISPLSLSCVMFFSQIASHLQEGPPMDLNSLQGIDLLLTTLSKAIVHQRHAVTDIQAMYSLYNTSRRTQLATILGMRPMNWIERTAHLRPSAPRPEPSYALAQLW